MISNASDAIDKLKFLALSDDSLYDGNGELKAQVSFDETNNTVTLSDNGIGMNREELIDNLGTIAKSDTKFSQLSGDSAKDSGQIGQFGVGFYSSFIVADSVDVVSLIEKIKGVLGDKFEINADHAMVKQLAEMDGDTLNDWVEMLYGQALLAENGSLEDTASFIAVVNRLLG